MKQTVLAALVGAVVALTADATVCLLSPRVAGAQEAEGAGNEQYKIVSLAIYGNDIAQMEQELNAHAAQGWRVRTGVGGGADSRAVNRTGRSWRTWSSGANGFAPLRGTG